MSRGLKWIIGIIIILAIAGGAYAIFHNPSYSPPASNSNQSSQNTPSPSTSNSIVLTKTSPTLGKYLTDPSGRALYTYNADTNGVSNCTGSCLAIWPAYTATSSMANLPSGITTITRSDNGKLQYAYNGKPLYYFASDSGTQVTGDGVENFSVAKPSSSSTTKSSTTNTTNQTNNSSGYPY